MGATAPRLSVSLNETQGPISPVNDVDLLSAVIETQNDIAAVELDTSIVTGMIAQRAQTLAQADGAIIEMIEGDEVLYASSAGIAGPYVGRRAQIKKSLSSICAETGELIYCPDCETEGRVNLAMTRALGIRSMVLVPLSHSGKVVGILKVLSKRRDAFCPRRITALRLMAGVCAAALAHASEFQIKRSLLAERTEALTALRASEDEYRAMFEHAGIGKAQLDLRTGKFLRVNQKLCDLLGYTRAELENLSFAEITHPDDIALGWDMLGKALAGNLRESTFEKRYVCKDGRLIWAIISTAFIYDTEGHPVRTVTSVQDITERKRGEWLERDRRAVLEMVARNLPLPEVLDGLADTVQRQMDASAAAVVVLEDGGICVHGPGRPQPWRKSLQKSGLALAMALAGKVWADTDHVGVTDIHTDPVWSSAKADLLAEGLHCCWTVAIHSTEGVPLGLLTIFMPSLTRPTPAQLQTLDLVAKLATICVEHHITTKQLTHMVRHDLLTGLPNRFMFEDRVQTALADAKRDNTNAAVMVLDVDKFKSINDTLGHHAGDQLLQQFSARLRSYLRDIDTMARMGGDEFVIVLPNLASRDEAATIAKRLVDCLVEPFVLGDKPVRATTSIGVAVFPQDADDAVSLQHQADAALYRAKQAGRNGFAF